MCNRLTFRKNQEKYMTKIISLTSFQYLDLTKTQVTSHIYFMDRCIGKYPVMMSNVNASTLSKLAYNLSLLTTFQCEDLQQANSFLKGAPGHVK